MMTGVRWFVVVILLLSVGTTVVPWIWRTQFSPPVPAYQPKLFVSIDGKAAGRDIVLLITNNETQQTEIVPCTKGRCHIQFAHYEKGWTDTIQKLDRKLPIKAVHSTPLRLARYETSHVQWSVDVTQALKDLDGDDYSININSAKRSAEHTEIITPNNGTTEPQPITLGLSNVDPKILQAVVLIFVVGVVYLGYKFISVGGHHH